MLCGPATSCPPCDELPVRDSGWHVGQDNWDLTINAQNRDLSWSIETTLNLLRGKIDWIWAHVFKASRQLYLNFFRRRSPL